MRDLPRAAYNLFLDPPFEKAVEKANRPGDMNPAGSRHLNKIDRLFKAVEEGVQARLIESIIEETGKRPKSLVIAKVMGTFNNRMGILKDDINNTLKDLLGEYGTLNVSIKRETGCLDKLRDNLERRK